MVFHAPKTTRENAVQGTRRRDGKHLQITSQKRPQRRPGSEDTSSITIRSEVAPSQSE